MSLKVIAEEPLLLDFQPLKEAASIEECCKRIEKLVEQMVARGHGFYLIEAQKYLDALPHWFIESTKQDSDSNDFFSLLLKTHNALSSEFRTKSEQRS